MRADSRAPPDRRYAIGASAPITVACTVHGGPEPVVTLYAWRPDFSALAWKLLQLGRILLAASSVD